MMLNVGNRLGPISSKRISANVLVTQAALIILRYGDSICLRETTFAVPDPTGYYSRIGWNVTGAICL